jgi:predicted amidohydrolase YtcJ
MLIRQAEINLGEAVVDVRIESGHITGIGFALPTLQDEIILEARGGALLPGLKDHHLHLFALAASLASLPCGPPQVQNAEQLSLKLRQLDQTLTAGEWIRGTGYHESVAGDITRDWLDACLPDRPLRIQHRSGRLWILNSCALEHVQTGVGDPLERIAGRCSGRLYDADGWLRSRLNGQRPSLRPASHLLASYGVTGVTDTTPHNDTELFQIFAQARERGELLQTLRVMGDATLDDISDIGGMTRGAHKFHLHDTELPEFDSLCADIRRSHAANREVAFHCVTRTDLVFALSALQDAGVRAGDRIEHASITPPELLSHIAELGLIVVTQPNFIAERGDHYLREVAADDRPWLYRLRSFVDAGVALAGSTDAPFGDCNPWKAMHAAVTRCSSEGALIGADERLTPEQALTLFLSPLERPCSVTPPIRIGMVADLCVLDAPWRRLRTDLASANVRATFCAGECVYQSG